MLRTVPDFRLNVSRGCNRLRQRVRNRIWVGLNGGPGFAHRPLTAKSISGGVPSRRLGLACRAGRRTRRPSGMSRRRVAVQGPTRRGPRSTSQLQRSRRCGTTMDHASGEEPSNSPSVAFGAVRRSITVRTPTHEAAIGKSSPNDIASYANQPPPIRSVKQSTLNPLVHDIRDRQRPCALWALQNALPTRVLRRLPQVLRLRGEPGPRSRSNRILLSTAMLH